MLETQWEFLKRSAQLDIVPHAMIFSGREGLGKRKTAFEFLKFLNCENKKENCKNCFSCSLAGKNKHPDILMRHGDLLYIEEIRNIQKFLALKPQLSIYKSLIIDKAERLSYHIQNSLLKILEEPKGKALIVLVTSKPDLLLETIRSRCQTLKFYPRTLSFKGTDNFKKVEEILGGDISQKLSFCQEFFKKELPDEVLNYFLDSFENYLRLALLKKIGIENKTLENFSLQLPKEFSVLEIKRAAEKLDNLKFLFLNTNVNSKLAFENFLLNL